MEACDNKDNQGPSYERMFMTLLESSQETAQTIKYLTKDNALINKHVFVKEIVNNDDSDN